MGCSSVAEAFQTIQREINLLEYQNKRLSEENSRLKNENYKDEELSKMKTQLEKIQKDYYRGFQYQKKSRKASANGWTNMMKKYIMPAPLEIN